MFKFKECENFKLDGIINIESFYIYIKEMKQLYLVLWLCYKSLNNQKAICLLLNQYQHKLTKVL